jgi:hypothetical protein
MLYNDLNQAQTIHIYASIGILVTVTGICSGLFLMTGDKQKF